jgi:hypothetical protein
MTSELQPLDAGIIKNVKGIYRQKQIQQYIHILQTDQQATANSLQITIKDALYLLSESWKEVKQSTIINCWRHSRILPVVEESGAVDDPTNNTTQRNIFHALTQLASTLQVPYTSHQATETADELIAAEVSFILS